MWTAEQCQITPAELAMHVSDIHFCQINVSDIESILLSMLSEEHHVDASRHGRRPSHASARRCSRSVTAKKSDESLARDLRPRVLAARIKGVPSWSVLGRGDFGGGRASGRGEGRGRYWATPILAAMGICMRLILEKWIDSVLFATDHQPCRSNHLWAYACENYWCWPSSLRLPSPSMRSPTRNQIRIKAVALHC